MGVALITPFKSDGSVDYNALVRLVEYQVQNGVDFLCVLGTTAETPTLTEEEKRQIKKVVIERVNGRVPILLGISSNCTQTVLNTLKNDTQMDDIIKNKPENFDVISGDDGITFPLITLGAVGVISVIGNAFPREFSRMTRLALAGDYNNALTIHHQFTELFKLLFVDGNPAGVKAMLSMMGMIENRLRLPLVPTRITTYEQMRRILDELKIKC